MNAPAEQIDKDIFENEISDVSTLEEENENENSQWGGSQEDNEESSSTSGESDGEDSDDGNNTKVCHKKSRYVI